MVVSGTLAVGGRLAAGETLLAGGTLAVVAMAASCGASSEKSRKEGMEDIHTQELSVLLNGGAGSAF